MSIYPSSRKSLIVFRPHSPGACHVLEALLQGFKKFNIESKIIDPRDFNNESLSNYDFVVTHTIKFGKRIVDQCIQQKKPVVYFDKGYTHRSWNNFGTEGYCRFSVNELHPTRYIMQMKCRDDRFRKLKLKLKRHRSKGKHIVFAGCTEKCGTAFGIDIHTFAKNTIQEVQRHTSKVVVYRPKKSNDPPPPIEGTIYSHNGTKIMEELHEAHALITFTSNAAVEALMAGVPIYVLGPGIALPLANTDLSTIENPSFPDDQTRYQFFSNLAYSQWNLKEIANGDTWKYLATVMQNHYDISL